MSLFTRTLLFVACLAAAMACLPSSEPPVVPEKEAKRDAQPALTDFYGDPLPPGAIARMGSTRLHHDAAIGSPAFSPDSKMLASASLDGTIRLWDVATGKELRSFPGQYAGGNIARFTPDGKAIVATG